MDSRIGLWARLTNADRSIHVASGDWERIVMRYGNVTPEVCDRWSEADSAYLWTAEEAKALADELVTSGGKQCIGSLMVDIDTGGGVSCTGHQFVADGVTPEERTARLVQFLARRSIQLEVCDQSTPGHPQCLGTQGVPR